MADAKKAGVNKSEEIRNVATTMKAKGEKPRPVAIIAALQDRGITVSSPQVSIVLKKMGFRPTRGRKAAGGVRKAAAVKPRDLLLDFSEKLQIEEIEGLLQRNESIESTCKQNA